MKQGFRPEYFAYHGWYDLNDYVDRHDHCSDIKRCSTRAVLKNLGGSWGGVEIWDTEVGVGQDGGEVIDENMQACGAAFLVRLTAKMSRRITRIYYTRFSGGAPRLYDGNTARTALAILADRQTTHPGCP